jgi:hypothetical protein
MITRKITKKEEEEVEVEVGAEVGAVEVGVGAGVEVGVGAGVDGKTWMGDFFQDEDTVFSKMKVIPTTHNSGAVHSKNPWLCLPWQWAKCQSVSIYEQLNMGIRCLDLRLRLPVGGDAGGDTQAKREDFLNRISIVHFFESSYSLQQVFDDVARFLKEHDKETVFIMIKAEWKTRQQWNREEIDLLWKQLFRLPYTLRTLGYGKSGTVSDWTFHYIRQKMVFLPGGRFYRAYKRGQDVYSIHGAQIIPPSFFTKYSNWNSKTIEKAKENIKSSMLVALSGNYPIVETNVVRYGGAMPPYFVCKQMHLFLKDLLSDKCGGDGGVRLGVLLLDFCESSVIQALLKMNNDNKDVEDA